MSTVMSCHECLQWQLDYTDDAIATYSTHAEFAAALEAILEEHLQECKGRTK